jgi:negative regulator of sigma E activity
MNEAIRMQLSAFVDGELPESEEELLLRRLGQDAELRQQVAEYLAIGRAMRGETGPRGLQRMRERIAAHIDDKPIAADAAPTAATGKRLARPAAVGLVAASVAAVALLGLQMTGVDDEASGAPAVVESRSFPTQPEAGDALQQYRLLHERRGSDIKARLTSVEIHEDTVESARDQDDNPDDETRSDSERAD